LIGGYDNSHEVELDFHSIEELKPTAPTKDMTKSDKNSLPLVWAGIGGTYFNGILRPLPIDSLKLSPEQYIQNVEADSIHPEIAAAHPRISMSFTTGDLKIDPGATLAIPMRVFFGPKPRWLLQNDYYSAPMMRYDATLVMSSGFCGACAIGWLINVLVDMMRAFHWVFGGFLTADGHSGDWGLAIIALVCVVRLLLHPITKKSQVNMLKMGKMGPEVERLKKKYGDDKEALSKAQMEMYKEMGFTPVLGCLPMFLQMPIFISLWQALQSTFEMRHAKFLWGLTWIKDLSQPDQLIKFSGTFDLWFLHLSAINVLPVLVAIVSFLNMKYTPRPPAATPEAAQQQKMMQWMTLVFPLMFYSFPSGLNLYYLTTTSIGIWEGKRIRAHIKEREEAENAGRVIVDASPGKRNRAAKTETRPQERTGLSGWISRLQEKAEQMRLEAEKKNRKN
jgi:YidC/Oxa1 family membrane protein insertase